MGDDGREAERNVERDEMKLARDTLRALKDVAFEMRMNRLMAMGTESAKRVPALAQDYYSDSIERK